MPVSIIKETIEVSSVTTDADGNAYLQKRINLMEGKRHSLIQTDLFNDTVPFNQLGGSILAEIVVSPYPSIPTNMDFQASPLAAANRLPSAGDDSVLFKAMGKVTDGEPTDFNQFPSLQIAANQFTDFYTDHLYITIHMMSGLPEVELTNIAFSFMFTMKSTNVPVLTHSMGVLAESHDAMCATLMENGHMISKATLRGNVFPMWRYGGIRPEFMLNPRAAGSFFLQLPSTDDEAMQNTAAIRTSVAAARSMAAFDSAFGNKFPDWVRFNLNEGFQSGPVRDQWPPIKHADNGNVLCL